MVNQLKLYLSKLILSFKKSRIFWIFAGSVIVFSTALFSFNLYYENKIYPGIFVTGKNVSGKTTDQAINFLSQQISPPEKVSLAAKNNSFDLFLKEVGFEYDFVATSSEAYSFYRSGNILKDLYNRSVAYFFSKDISLKIKIDEERLDEYLRVISGQVSTEPRESSVSLNEGKVVVDKGSIGEEVDIQNVRKTFEKKLSVLDFSPIEVSFIVTDPTINDEQAENLSVRAEKFLNKKLVLTHEYDEIPLAPENILSFLRVEKNFDEEKIATFIKNQVSPKLNREPQNAVFRFLPAQAGEEGKVIEFLPSKDGVVVNEEGLTQEIVKNLEALEESNDKILTLKVPVGTSQPKITNDQVNSLGIKELIGRGSSRFRGSIASRIHNIGLASSKFDGILVAPGETFSFNKNLGDVSAFTGYKQAYIIKDGKTVLGDGGGVCQVSTTLFRALLNAGLPIIERRAHSYRVGYYEQDSSPGLDATVFDPTTDLKFQNDTPGHLLIQTIFNPNALTLVFEIYGTKDGRIATTTKPVVTSVTAPPEDLYVDDPSLPTGQVKQIDYKAWGAKVTFNYRVERDGQTLFEKTFLSNYRPWQAVYLRGTGPAN